jgi:DNA-binding MurR/RpiR family transcriptional regulator
MLEVARVARARGASLLVLTNKPEGAFAKIATGVLRLRTDSEGSSTTVCEQAAMSYLGVLAARIFKKHQPQFEVLEEELRRLASEIEGALVRMSDAVSPMASELAAFKRVCVLGGGFYYSTALQAEYLFRRLGNSARAADPMELDSLDSLDQNGVFLVVSGSRCRARKRLHTLLKQAVNSRARIISITDSNDRETTEMSALSVLLPNLSEMVGAVLTSVLIHWLTCQKACHMSSTGQCKPGDAAVGRGLASPEVSF